MNDAPAMAVATLSIAMGAAGTDAAIETADIALMSDDLSKVPWLIDHSNRTSRTIKQNIGFALGVKLLFMVLATVLGVLLIEGLLSSLLAVKSAFGRRFEKMAEEVHCEFDEELGWRSEARGAGLEGRQRDVGP